MDIFSLEPALAFLLGNEAIWVAHEVSVYMQLYKMLCGASNLCGSSFTGEDTMEQESSFASLNKLNFLLQLTFPAIS